MKQSSDPFVRPLWLCSAGNWTGARWQRLCVRRRVKELGILAGQLVVISQSGPADDRRQECHRAGGGGRLTPQEESSFGINSFVPTGQIRKFEAEQQKLNLFWRSSGGTEAEPNRMADPTREGQDQTRSMKVRTRPGPCRSGPDPVRVPPPGWNYRPWNVTPSHPETGTSSGRLMVSIISSVLLQQIKTEPNVRRGATGVTGSRSGSILQSST